MVAHEIHCHFIESNGCLSIAISLVPMVAFQPLDPVDRLAKGWLPLKTIDSPIESIGCLSKTI